MQIHPFEPIFDKSSKILILGSFPSVRSRLDGFYYAHKQNRFWKVLSLLFDEPKLNNVKEKVDFLLRHKVALYDAAFSCDVKGSSDSSMKNIFPTNLNRIFENTKIEQVFANGVRAYIICKKFHKFEPVKLPSTSPANAKYKLEDLLEEWKIILKYLE
ncbi:DNA-deoxyinosine glycosylase [Campylobacter hyointestinalis subsp. hyointestinalis]|uniref:Mug G:T/U mismatch-specific DNA glycosylase n=1 Tax=Campylobacter hyointestinalis subsp. hyointestinalis TaxID=91352 RepID=A0A9W5EX98_CAMHY|nr:DNA-deoxyinosine glycosylase [Campylobacter hyointestinalis]PPB57212.1 DNA-deoxyinosine glycosylase [Campylobacter hyointestinalis subsp. hyointestinalis]PPB66984.1 DNA-deoxyinosine glycosylase [Campylobacter hyointestinalis subsp. hyointestinalis]QCU00271.1 DNA-deoxyinosine glycosylase [Campylobacter hyointestinalis subsp. hyointestinalis]CUU86350.1 Mug G:T/U mismatch-specific DNA glycosylase [Campylobacter hyointestinalis subsp. hyointestinalis]CUU91285.1 Mug G:T/U mismatch-specific DNA g